MNIWWQVNIWISRGILTRRLLHFCLWYHIRFYHRDPTWVNLGHNSVTETHNKGVKVICLPVCWKYKDPDIFLKATERDIHKGIWNQATSLDLAGWQFSRMKRWDCRRFIWNIKEQRDKITLTLYTISGEYDWLRATLKDGIWRVVLIAQYTTLVPWHESLLYLY